MQRKLKRRSRLIPVFVVGLRVNPRRHLHSRKCMTATKNPSGPGRVGPSDGRRGSMIDKFRGVRTEDATSDVEGRLQLPTLLTNGRLENVLEIESTPTSVTPAKCVKTGVQIAGEQPTMNRRLGWPPTNRVRRHLRSQPYRRDTDVDHRSSHLHWSRRRCHRLSSDQPLRCAVHCRRRVGTVIIARRRLRGRFLRQHH